MLWVLFASLCTVLNSTFTKIAATNGKTSGSMYINALKVGASCIFFILISFYKLQFHLPTVLYASVYGSLLYFSTLFGYMALMHGSMALSSLIVSYSVIIPCIFGLLFLEETVSLMRILGIVFLFISMYLLKKRAENVNMSKQWILYVAITFLCNGICSVIQKLHQIAYPSMFCNEFMIYASIITFIPFLILAIRKKEEKNTGIMRYSVLAGVLMGMGNYLTLMLASKVDATVLFPILSAFSMLCNVTISKVYFKDKFSSMQLCGIGLGVLSVLLIK